MEGREFTAKTVEDAVEAGLKELGLNKDEVTVEVLEEPTSGFLGIGAKKAKVRITPVEQTSLNAGIDNTGIENAEVSGGKVHGKEVGADAERAAAFLDKLLELLGVEAKTETTVNEDGTATIEIDTEKTAAVIGYRGETLDALQTLASAVSNTGKSEYTRLVVDCKGYRAKRENTLKELAANVAAKAVRLGRKIMLEPMNPFERRVIHSALADSTEVKTISEGKEPNRYVAIVPNEIKNPHPIRDDHARGRRDGDRRNGYDRPSGRGRNDRGRGDRQGRSGHGYNRDGYKGGSSSAKKPSKSVFGGTYIGNSFKDNND